jgi:hypothetical protein
MRSQLGAVVLAPECGIPMTADYATEFETVDIVIKSGAETSGVDAFALALIKAERQIRKLVTHLVYQFPCFGPSDVPSLRQALATSRRALGYLLGGRLR